MDVNDLIERSKQFKTPAEQVAFFIGYQLAASDIPQQAAVKAPRLKISAVEVVKKGKPKLALKKPGHRIKCGRCGKGIIARSLKQMYCRPEQNPKCFKAWQKAYDKKRHEKLKKKQLNLTPPPGAKTVLADAIAKASEAAKRSKIAEANRARYGVVNGD